MALVIKFFLDTPSVGADICDESKIFQNFIDSIDGCSEVLVFILEV